MPFESLHSDFCRNSYGRFSKTAQDRPKLCTIVFYPNFREAIVVIMHYTIHEIFRDFLSFLYLGSLAQLEVRGERYEFSKVDLQTVI